MYLIERPKFIELEYYDMRGKKQKVTLDHNLSRVGKTYI